MKVKELFEIKIGVNLELNTLEETSDISGINFVARTSQNNGVTAKVKPIPNLKPNEAGTLSCAGGGSVLSTFVQTEPYYSGRDLYVLKPKTRMTLKEKLYYSHLISENKYKYSYGRQANKTLGEIELPDTLPKWLDSFDLSRASTLISTDIKGRQMPFDTSQWKEFTLGNLFKIQSCKCSNASELIDGDDLFYIGAKKNNNGVMKKVAYDSSMVSKGNCIVFICDGQGSVGYTNYVGEDFIGSTTLSAGYHPNLNEYIGLFLVTILDLERPKFSFGRKYRNTLNQTAIKLPVDKDENPDWIFMENFVKNLPYSDKIGQEVQPDQTKNQSNQHNLSRAKS